MKLKLGSQRGLTLSSEEAVGMESDCSTANVSRSSMESNCSSRLVENSSQCLRTLPDEEAMTIDTDCSSENVHLSFSGCQSIEDLKQHRSRNVSVLYLFSKYKNSRQGSTSSSYGDAMIIAAGDGSATTSPSSSSCQSPGTTKEQSEHEFSSVCQM